MSSAGLWWMSHRDAEGLVASRENVPCFAVEAALGDRATWSMKSTPSIGCSERYRSSSMMSWWSMGVGVRTAGAILRCKNGHKP